MSIKGKTKIELSKELILSKISEYDIFKFYNPLSFEINKKAFSPFRKEKVKSFSIFYVDNKLLYKDYAEIEYKGNCFKFVQQLFNILEYKDVLIKIAQDFGIIENNKIVNYEIIQLYKQPDIVEKPKTIIQVKVRDFTDEELEYWKTYHISLLELKQNNIYSIKELYLNKQRVVLNSELKFGYFNNKCWKIYTPFSKDKNFKWFPNNIPITTMYGLENIVECDVCIITKSLKDYIVLRKVYQYVCAVQNEGSGCFSAENVKYLKENSKIQILNFDSDVAGVKNSQKLTKQFDFDYLNVPKQYLEKGINDFADLAKHYGLEIVKKIVNEKINKLKNE